MRTMRLITQTGSKHEACVGACICLGSSTNSRVTAP